MVHYRGGRAAIDESVYPDLEPFWADLTAAYAEQVRRVAELGCTYLQLDDTSLAYLNDPEQRALVASQGGDPDHLHEQYVRNVNAAIAGRPDGLRVTTHMCRGNFRSSWAAEGGYDFVAEVLFSQLDVDGFFLEYDDERSGGFEPLRFVPEGKQVVLGLVTTKTGRARGQGRPEAPHRRGGEVRPARTALPLAPVRVLIHRRGQRADSGAGAGQAAAGRGDRRGSVGIAMGLLDGVDLGGQGLQGRRVDRRGRRHVRRGRAGDRGRARHDGPGRRRRRRRGRRARRPRRSGSGRRCRTPRAPRCCAGPATCGPSTPTRSGTGTSARSAPSRRWPTSPCTWRPRSATRPRRCPASRSARCCPASSRGCPWPARCRPAWSR